MLTPKITLQAIQPEDWKALARLEVGAFGEEEFSAVAFGPNRFDEIVLEERAKEMGIITPKPGEVIRNVKAVLKREDGKEQIVGYAAWQTVLVGEGGVGIYGYGKRAGFTKEEQEEEVKKKESKVKTVANAKLCDDLFIPGDQSMALACECQDYHKLYTLVVDPAFQRRGIGSMLLEDGLNEADSKNLQCTLGASPEGLGLYEKHGFVEFSHISLNLWEYEGGEGKGVVEHSIMHRKAQFKI